MGGNWASAPSQAAICWVKLSRGILDCQTLPDLSGWPVSWRLGRDPKLLRRAVLLAELLPVWQEAAFNLREYYSAESCLSGHWMNYLLSPCGVNAAVCVVYPMLATSEVPLKMCGPEF